MEDTATDTDYGAAEATTKARTRIAKVIALSTGKVLQADPDAAMEARVLDEIATRLGDGSFYVDCPCCGFNGASYRLNKRGQLYFNCRACMVMTQGRTALSDQWMLGIMKAITRKRLAGTP